MGKREYYAEVYEIKATFSSSDSQAKKAMESLNAAYENVSKSQKLL